VDEFYRSFAGRIASLGKMLKAQEAERTTLKIVGRELKPNEAKPSSVSLFLPAGEPTLPCPRL
jgi:precorrin-4 methylase